MKWIIVILFIITPYGIMGQLLFDKNFDGGSLDSSYLAEGFWNVNYSTSLHFRVIGCTSLNPVFRIWVNPNWTWHFRATHRMVWKYNSSSSYSYMDTAWVSGGYYHFRNDTAFSSDTIFIAYLFPFSYNEMVYYINTIQTNQWIRNAGVRGHSVLGRNIYGYEITNPSIPDSSKKRIVITARQHPYETLGQHICLGLSDYLVNSTDTFAVWLRNNCIFYFYPMVNPDGVYLGLNTDTYQGYNPNRFWFNGDTVSNPSPCRETNVVRQDIWQRTGNRVYYSFDMHSNAGSLIYYYCGLRTAPEPFKSMAFDIVANIRKSDSLINDGNILMPSDMACDTYQSTNWYADFWLWNNRQAVAFTLESATVPPQSLTRTRNIGIAIARGIYLSLRNQLTGIQTASTGIPAQFSLSQNYPNPFNPNTNIEFTLGAMRNIRIVINDVLGREVIELLNQRYPAGSHRVMFDGKHYSSGVYYYSMFVEGTLLETKKMLLIK
ncbi:MAG: T9SS type A sorting domain-containing protein [Ignavibacteria bacterium]|nr:T9SS type A sorting domain-containing protein [Ignavibacteria bacterium]